MLVKNFFKARKIKGGILNRLFILFFGACILVLQCGCRVEQYYCIDFSEPSNSCFISATQELSNKHNVSSVHESPKVEPAKAAPEAEVKTCPLCNGAGNINAKDDPLGCLY